MKLNYKNTVFVGLIFLSISMFWQVYDNIVSKILSAPGKALQHLTVFEPDDGMIEVAIEAMKLVIPEEKGTDEW